MAIGRMLLTWALALLLLSPGAGISATGQTARSLESNQCVCPPAFHHSTSAAASDPPTYDEQIGLSYAQSLPTLAVNVTAVEQSDPVSQTGPAYLLNGLTDTGYWYQVGLAWNWNPQSSPGLGFDLIFAVFNSAGVVVYPNAQEYLVPLSGPVNKGDQVLLSINFTTSGNVLMLVRDWDTGSTASESYSSEGATIFEGFSSPQNALGFFSGLMTEWYHSSEFSSNISPVDYTHPGAPVASAWMWIDEFSCGGVTCANRTLLFSGSTPAAVTYTGPNVLKEYSSHGATEFSSSNELITGPAYRQLTASYSIEGGGTGYSAPAIDYVSNGTTLAAQLSTSPSSLLADAGSTWSVPSVLSGSGSSERWAIVDQQPRGNASSTQSFTFVYQHQYFLGVSGGSARGAGTGWYPSGSNAEAISNRTYGREGGEGYRVTGYSIDGQGRLLDPTSGPVTLAVDMNSSHSVKFVSTTQYLVSLDPEATMALYSSTPPTIPGDTGWYDSGTNVTLVFNRAWDVIPGTSRDVASSYSVAGALPTSVQEEGNGTFMVDLVLAGASKVVLGYKTQFFFGETVTGPGGAVTPGSGWYDAGSTVYVTATPTLFLYQFDGWSGALSGSSSASRVTLDSPQSVVATFSFNYPLLLACIAAVALAVASVVVYLRRRSSAMPGG